MANRVGRPSAAQTPAPKSERIYGSKKNRKGSATSENSKSIQLSKDTIDILKDKLNEFKKNNPNNTSITLNDLKAVYRRGSGAYSSSHRPTITGGAPNSRAAWSMARVNKFLKKASGEKVKAAYIQDDDLMQDGGLVSSLTVSMSNLKKNGIVLTDKEKMYTVIAYNTGGQERSGALYNKSLIYRSVLHLRQANEIIEMFDKEAYSLFDESKMAEYRSSPNLIILNQNEVVYNSVNPNPKYKQGGEIVPVYKIAHDVYVSKDKEQLPEDGQILMHRYHDKFKYGELGIFCAKEEDLGEDNTFGDNILYVSIGKDARVKKINSTFRYLKNNGMLHAPNERIKEIYGYETIYDLFDDMGSLDNPDIGYYEIQRAAILDMRKNGEDFEVLEMTSEDEFVPHQFLITTFDDEQKLQLQTQNKNKMAKGKLDKGGEINKYLHLYKLIYPDGTVRIEKYEGEQISPKEAMEKMRISLRGLKSYQYKGASPLSSKYKSWYERKSKGDTDVQAYNNVFEKDDNYAKGGKIERHRDAVYEIEKLDGYNPRYKIVTKHDDYEAYRKNKKSSNNDGWGLSMVMYNLLSFDKNNLEEFVPKENLITIYEKYAKGGWIGSYKKQIKTSDVPEFLNETKDDGHKYSLWNKGVGTTYAYNGKLYANNGEVLPKGTVINLNDRMDFWAKANCEILFLEDEKLVVLPEKQDKYNCYTTGYDGMRSKYGNEDNVTLKEAVDFCWHYTEVKNKYATKEDLEKEIISTPYGKENVISSTGNISGIVVYKLPSKQFAQGGRLKTLEEFESTGIVIGDNAKGGGKVGVIVKVEGRLFTLRFPNGAEETFNRDDLYFYQEQEEEQEDELDWNNINDLKEERNRLLRWANNYNSKGVDGTIYQIEQRIKLLESKKMANGGIVSSSDIIEGAKFQTSSGIVWCIDKVEQPDADSGLVIVSTSMESGKKGNYKDEISEVAAFLNEEGAVKMAKGGAVSKGFKFEGTERELILYLQARKDKNAVHANIFQYGGYHLFIFDANDILFDKKYPTHEEARVKLNEWIENNAKNNKEKYAYGTIADVADINNYYFSIAGDVPKEVLKEKMAKGGVVSRYRIVLNKSRDGQPNIIEPDYKKAIDFDGSVVGAEAAAMNFLLDNISTHVSANVTKIHSSGNAMKNKKVMIVEPNYVQRFEQGGEIEESSETIRPMFIGDAVVYEDSTWYITQKDGLLGIMSFKQGAWGSDYPFIPLGKIRISEELRDMMGRKVSVEGIHYAKGGAIAGEWVVYNGMNNKWISTRKSHRSALMMQNRLMESGNYESVGIINKAEWDANNGRAFKEGGMLLPKELQGRVYTGHIWGDENRKHTTGSVYLEDLKVMPLGVDTAKKTFETDKKFQPTSKPIIVGVDVVTGEKQLLDGYHRWYAKDGKGRKSALFIPMKNGDIISFDEINNPDSQDPIIALPDTQCSVSRLNEILSSQGYVIQKNNNNGVGEMQKMDTGGVVVGKRHHEMDEHGNTGETFVVEDTGEVVEVEGGEGVLCTSSMQSDKVYDFEGEKLTGREIASILNSRYGGVKFAKGGKVSDCGCNIKYMYKHGGELPSATLESLHGGNAVVTVKTMQSQDKYAFQGTKKTPREILSRINADHGGKKFEEGGVLDFTDYDFDILNKMTKMVYFTEKIGHN